MFKKLTALFISILLVVGCMGVPAMAAEKLCPVTYDISATAPTAIEMEWVYYDGKTVVPEPDTSTGKSWKDCSEASNKYLYYIGWQSPGEQEMQVKVNVAETGYYSVDFVANSYIGGFSNIKVYVGDILVGDTATASTDNRVYANTCSTPQLHRFERDFIHLTKGENTVRIVASNGNDRNAYCLDYIRFTPFDGDLSDGALTIKKAAWSDRVSTNITTGYAGIGNNGWITYEFDVPIDAKYDVVLNGGTTGGIILETSINGQNVTELFESTSTESTEGWNVPEDKVYGSFYLKKGIHTLTVTGKSSGSIWLKYVTLKSEGEFKELAAPHSTVDGSSVILSFESELLSDEDNLAKISVTGGTGTAAIAFDESDNKKVIISNVVGSFTVKVCAGIKNTDKIPLYNDYEESFYFPSCTITQKTIFEYDNSYYGQITFDTDGRSPHVQMWLALYDDAGNLIGYAGNSDYGLWDGRQISISLPMEEYKDRLSQIKLFAWEQDMTPLMQNVTRDY